MDIELILTSAQSKRLIAKGVKAHPVMQRALRDGTIGICRGTTCTYVAEELLGRTVEHFSYTTGLTLPPSPTPPVTKPGTTEHDIIIRAGKVTQEGVTVIEAARDMHQGDVIIKGANALNYNAGIAGCLVEHPAGGTIGGFSGPVWGRKISLIIPVGLEKEISADILEIAALTMEAEAGPALVPLHGIIMTELEALEFLAGVDAVQIAAGGIRGAEGAVRLLASGTKDQVQHVQTLVEELAAERPF